jgi:hypothetical protein
MKQFALIFIVLFIAVIIYLATKPPKDITLKDMIKYSAPKGAPAKRNQEPVFQQTDENGIPGSDSIEYPGQGGSLSKPETAGEGNALNSANSGSKDTEAAGTPASEPVSGTVCYYIILESCRNFKLAQERAEKWQDSFKTKIIVLPPTPEGYCRISHGQYATREEAEAAMITVRKKVSTDVWIFSAKK